MGVMKFEDLLVWQEAMKLAGDIYSNLKSCQDYRLRDQMQKSAVSIASNIAEGFERKSNKEYIYFLYVALGSCGELRTQIYLAKHIKLFDLTLGDSLIYRTRKISSMLFSLIQTRKKHFT